MSRFLAIEELHPGDVLLSRGRGDISRWMAWNGECRYTHAAIVIDAHDCVEAVMPAARRRSLLRHVAAPSELIDVFRPVRGGGRALDAVDHGRIARIAAAQVGRPFAASWMLPLALRTLVHHKLGLAPGPGAHRPGVTCTELVYLILDEAIGMPTLRARRRERLPRPALRPRRLWSEYLRFRRSERASDKTAPGETEHGAASRMPLRSTPHRIAGTDLLPGDLAGCAALRHLGRLR